MQQSQWPPVRDAACNTDVRKRVYLYMYACTPRFSTLIRCSAAVLPSTVLWVRGAACSIDERRPLYLCICACIPSQRCQRPLANVVSKTCLETAGSATTCTLALNSFTNDLTLARTAPFNKSLHSGRTTCLSCSQKLDKSAVPHAAGLY